jgi:hypothetical protein
MSETNNKNELFIHDSKKDIEEVGLDQQYLACATRVEGSTSDTTTKVSLPSFFFLRLGGFFFLPSKPNELLIQDNIVKYYKMCKQTIPGGLR